MAAVDFKVGDVLFTSGSSEGGEIQLSQITDVNGNEGTLGQFLSKSVSGLLWADLASSSTLVSGLVQLATDAEAQSGVVSTKAVVPSALQSKLSDSTSTTSSTTIASSTAVKSAYDLAAAAVPNSAFTAKGSIVVGTGTSTYGALGIGTDAYVLTADSTQSSGVKWAPSAGGGGGGTSPMASANTLFVNPTTGNNSTAARGNSLPFLTLTAALTAALEGDFIFISPGTLTENVIINKGVTIQGTFQDQGTWQGTKILGNAQINLSSSVIRNLSINNVYFISANSTPVLRVVAHATGAGNTIISNCGFTQQTATDVNQFAYSSDAVNWTRAIYMRNCLLDGNVKHNAGTAAGASGYLVFDGTIGAGSSNYYYHVLTGTVEFRSPTNSISPIYQTGGSVSTRNVTSWTNNSATTTTIFGGTGFNYKGSAASVGTGTVYFGGGYNTVGGKVDIGANLVYGWTNLNVTPANLTVNGSAVAYTTSVPSSAGVVVAQQTRPRYDLLTTASSVAATNRLPTVIDSTTGIFYSVAPIDLPLTTLTLTSTTLTTLLSVAAATFRGVVIDVSVSDVTGGNFYTDTLQVNHNGTTANLQVIGGARIGTAPYTASAAVTAGNLVVSVTSASTNSTKYVGNYMTFAI